MTAPQRPVLRYFGGKWGLAPWIISHFPPHRIYVEPFGGAASVLMRKPRSYAEVYNDMDSDVVNLFRILRNPCESKELERLLTLTPFGREEFYSAYEIQTDPMEQARALMIRSYMGFGSDSCSFDFGKTGFRANSNRSGTSPAHDWLNLPGCLSAMHERLAGVVIESRDAREVMIQQDSEETLHFVDPPYVHETRRSKNNYKFEMTNKQHEELLEFLQSLKGMIVLAGYDNPIYQRLGWSESKRESLADGARKRTEFIWMNPAAVKAACQLSLFERGTG